MPSKLTVQQANDFLASAFVGVQDRSDIIEMHDGRAVARLDVNESHLRRVLTEYVEYYNSRRPHQGLNQQSPIPSPPPKSSGLIQRRKVLGGIINDYFRIAEDAVVYVN